MSFYTLRGPLSIRAGSRMIPRINSSSPSTAIPTMRNGSRISQIRGYEINASNASGQHKNNKMHHSRNASTTVLASLIGEIRTGLPIRFALCSGRSHENCATFFVLSHAHNSCKEFLGSLRNPLRQRRALSRCFALWKAYRFHRYICGLVTECLAALGSRSLETDSRRAKSSPF